MQRQPQYSSLSTNRIRLDVAYDGADFCGWAAQREQRTVLSTLTEAVRQISGEENEIIGASRTDSGANALGQVCHFDSDCTIPPERWKLALNPLLPSDVRVLRSRKVHPEFHSRFWAIDRHYRYRFLSRKEDPLRARQVFVTPAILDWKLMNQSVQYTVGKHDFQRFSQKLDRRVNTVREVFSAEVRKVRDEIWLDVVGSAFVKGMMRRIAGALFEIGRGKEEPEYIRALLEAGKNRKMQLPPVLPASGLTLMRIRYGRHPSERARKRNTDTESKDE